MDGEAGPWPILKDRGQVWGLLVLVNPPLAYPTFPDPSACGERKHFLTLPNNEKQQTGCKERSTLPNSTVTTKHFKRVLKLAPRGSQG